MRTPHLGYPDAELASLAAYLGAGIGLRIHALGNPAGEQSAPVLRQIGAPADGAVIGYWLTCDPATADRPVRRPGWSAHSGTTATTARLSLAEVPAPTGHRPARPPWCGESDQATRMLGFDGAAPVSVLQAKPTTTASRASPATPFACARGGSSEPPRALRSPTVKDH